MMEHCLLMLFFSVVYRPFEIKELRDVNQYLGNAKNKPKFVNKMLLIPKIAI